MKKMVLLFVILIIPIKVFSLNVTATSSILMDMGSKRILYASNIHDVRSVASISKVMTAILAIESGKLDNVVVVGEEIKEAYGSAVYLQIGEEITLRDLVYALMLRSGNDAAMVIAQYVGEGEFVEMMNSKAQEIGMKNTTFNNPCGLDEEAGNYSTAYDMALLTSYAMQLEEYKDIVNTKMYSLKTNKNSYVWFNKHKLLGVNDYITGGKTGFTKKAKRTLITTASKDNLNLVAVTLNDGNDFKDHLDMLEYGFENYINYLILKKGKLNVYDDIYYGVYDLSIKNDIYYPVSSEDDILIKYQLEEKPKEGEAGHVLLIVNGEEVKREIIFSKKIIEKDKKSLLDWIKKLW